MTTPLSGALRLLSGLFLLSTVGWTGYAHRSAWIILLFGIVFTFLYVLGKWPQWKKGWEEGGLSGWLAGLALTFPLQLVLASLVYLIGLGLGRLFASQSMATGLTGDDFWTAGVLLVVMMSTGLIIIWLESSHKQALKAQAEFYTSMLEATEEGDPALDSALDPALDSALDSGSNHEFDLNIEPTSASYENFWAGPHFSNEKNSEGASDEEIATTEKRLGVSLPPKLRDLYKMQNGGVTEYVWVPINKNPGNSFGDWTGAFAYDYNDIRPLGDLETLETNYTENKEDDDPDAQDWFPQCDKLIILTHRYDDTTMLDYRKSAKPAVILADLDNAPEKRTRLSFVSFDDFFNALRREK